MEFLFLFGGAGVVLLILCLVVRETTEQRLAKMRAELMKLRSQVRVLEERIKSYQLVQSQVREVLVRIDSRKLSTHDTIESLYANLRELYLLLREEELPETPEDTAEAREEAEASAAG